MEPLLNIPSIAEREIPKEAYKYDSYNGFLYEFSLIKSVKSPITGKMLPEGKYYLGGHGSNDPNKDITVDDGYWQSCKDPEFKLLFSGSEPIFKHKVWGLAPDWDNIKDEENMLLEERNATASEMSWNGNNGFPVHARINRKACKKMADEINKRHDCKWPVRYEDPAEHSDDKISSLQVRAADDITHKDEIKQLINDAGGVVDLDKNPDIDPVVIFEERDPNGKALRVDGNMTTGAIRMKDCLAPHIPTIRIPLKDHKHLSDDEVRHTALILNRRGSKIKKPTVVEDAIKFILGISDNGNKKYNTPFNRKMIKEDYDLSSKQLTRVMDRVKYYIYEEEQAIKNSVLIDYDDAQKGEKVRELEEKYPNTIIFYVSAKVGMKIPAMILKYINDDVNQAKLDDREPYTKIILAVHFAKSKSARDYWRQVGGEWDNLSKRWKLLDTKYELDYKEFALTQDDTKIAS